MLTNTTAPAWAGGASGGRTPAWKQDGMGGRTPAYAPDGSRTVNPFDGSRTAYGAGGVSNNPPSTPSLHIVNLIQRTPAWQSGSKTPYGESGFASSDSAWAAGGKTPAYNSSNSHNDPWGGSKTPAPNDSWNSNAQSSESWGASRSYDAPTPGAELSAPTPGALNAPTPGAYAAPTPAASAPTPRPGWGGGWGAESAPTPAPVSAPTPGGKAWGGAPTPFNPPETPGNWGGGDEGDGGEDGDGDGGPRYSTPSP
jgi:transcription elongation factor SPT5